MRACERRIPQSRRRPHPPDRKPSGRGDHCRGRSHFMDRSKGEGLDCACLNGQIEWVYAYRCAAGGHQSTTEKWVIISGGYHTEDSSSVVARLAGCWARLFVWQVSVASARQGWDGMGWPPGSHGGIPREAKRRREQAQQDAPAAIDSEVFLIALALALLRGRQPSLDDASPVLVVWVLRGEGWRSVCGWVRSRPASRPPPMAF
jgi:hypothetical protein